MNYKKKQELMGIAIYLLSWIMTWVLDGDGTFLLIALPVSLLLIFTKKNLLEVDYESEDY